MAEKIVQSEIETFRPSGDVESSPSKNDESDGHESVALYSGKDTMEEKTLIRKQDVRILPLCVSMYLLSFLDRSNIGNARVLNADTDDDVSFPAPRNITKLITLCSYSPTPK